MKTNTTQNAINSTPTPATGAVRSTARLGIFALAMINVSAIVSLRGLPAESTYGLGSIFYYIFAAVCFLIPVSLVAAELTTGWPQKGGVFRWVGEAFGTRVGFLAIWLQWIESTIWFPTVLTFAAVSLAFIGPDQKWDEALAANKWYVLCIVLMVYWTATFLNFKGMKTSGTVTKWGTMIGTIIPAGILILCGAIYYFQGRPIQMDMSMDKLIPDLSNFNNLVLASSIFLFYAGMEMSAVHVKDVRNPNRDYPMAIFLASIITVLIFVLGTLAVGFIIPESQVNLVQTLLVSYDDFFSILGLSSISWLMAVCLAIGVLAQVTAWVMGPSKGLLQVGMAGYLPRFMQKTNTNNVQIGILLIQGCVVTILSIMFVVMPSVQTAYQIISQLTIILYLIMYILMFSAGIYLRHAEPEVKRAFRIPGGKYFGMWVIGGIGLIGAILAFFLSFVPPSQIPIGSPSFYVTILVVGTFFFAGVPFLIYAVKKPEWKNETSEEDAFEPFNWELKQAAALKNTTPPSTTSTSAPNAKD